MRLRNLILPTLAVLSLSACMGSTTEHSDTSGPSDNIQPPTIDPAPPALPDVVVTVDTWAVAELPFEYNLPATFKDDAAFKAISLPKWMQIDEQAGILFGTPNEEDVTAAAQFVIEKNVDGATTRYEGTLAVLHTAAMQSTAADDYYQLTWDGKKRALRNDIDEGSLAGEIQFIQSHTSAPNGNWQPDVQDETKSVYRTDVHSNREALLIFIPEEGINPITVDVTVTVPGKVTETYSMAHPNDLPRADKEDGRAIVYSKRAWSFVLPYDSVRAGLELNFIVDKGAETEKQGTLYPSSIDFAKATFLETQALRVGYLSAPPRNDSHLLVTDPISAATDYFQTLPVSKLTMGVYAEMQLDSVIVSRGENGKAKIYHGGKSDTNGDIYSGDMREDVGKSTISVGIDSANYGVSSNTMEQKFEAIYKSRTSHFAQGNYQNGLQGHCCSGGNGISTLAAGVGNEVSHEWGHDYNLGHYPWREKTRDGRWAFHHPDTGWGYFAQYGRMHTNLGKYVGDTSKVEECRWGPDYPGGTGALLVTARVCSNGWIYQNDPMSGGAYGTSPLTRYTYYVSHTAKAIQNYLGQFPQPTKDFASGYKKWNEITGEYEEFSAGKPIPVKVGVPVATILGGYDPDASRYGEGEERALIYPTFHGNRGNVFNLPAPNLADGSHHCWMDIENAAGTHKLVEVANERVNPSWINRISINLEASFKPTQATLYCGSGTDASQWEVLASKELNGLDLTDQLPPAVVVGEEAGFEQYKQRDMKQIEAGIQALAPNRINEASATLLLQIASYSEAELKEKLTYDTWQHVKQLLDTRKAISNISAVINYSEISGQSDEDTKNLLLQYLSENNLLTEESGLHIQGNPLLGFNGVYAAPNTSFIPTELTDGKIMVSRTSEGAEQHNWIMDSLGKVHIAASPDKCLVGSNPVTIADCDNSAANQRWLYRLNDNDRPSLVASNGQCADFYAAQGHLGLYGCSSGGWNQTWFGLNTSNELWLALLPVDTMREIFKRIDDRKN